MYKEYAADPQMRINLGIRRRLAPLVNYSRRRLELLNSLLLSFPGTPVLYYGDEIGMGDNIYLGDRNGVRTPMQWSGDRNAGFCRTDFARLFAAPIMDPVTGYQADQRRGPAARPLQPAELDEADDRPPEALQGVRPGHDGVPQADEPQGPGLRPPLQGRHHPLRGEPLPVRPAVPSSTSPSSRG